MYLNVKNYIFVSFFAILCQNACADVVICEGRLKCEIDGKVCTIPGAPISFSIDLLSEKVKKSPARYDVLRASEAVVGLAIDETHDKM